MGGGSELRVCGSRGGCGDRSMAQAGAGVWDQNLKTEPLGLSFGCADKKVSRGRWEKVVGWCVRSSSCSGVLRSFAQAGAAGLGQKSETSCLGSILGALIKTTARVDGGMLLGGAYEVVVMVGWRV
jgi:hypothetical protein